MHGFGVSIGISGAATRARRIRSGGTTDFSWVGSSSYSPPPGDSVHFTWAINSYQHTILDDLPVAYWRLDETSGTTAKDQTGKGRDGTYQGTFTQGQTAAIQSGTSVDFAEEGEVSVPDNTAFEFAGNFSIEFWIKTTDAGNVGIIEKDGNGAYSIQLEGGGDDRPKLNVGGSSAEIISNNTISDDKWHHLVFVYTGGDGNGKVFIDGVDDTATDGSGTPSYGSGNLFLGSAGGRFTGIDASLDEIAMYDFVLTAAQVQEHYQTGKGASFVTWDFDDGTLQGWSDPQGVLGPDDQVFFEGGWSMGSDAGNVNVDDLGGISPTELSGGRKINMYSFYYWERSSSTGSLIQARDSNGNDVITAGTNNPEWTIRDANGFDIVNSTISSPEYEHWVYVQVVFDWNNGTADVLFSRQDKSVLEVYKGRPLRNNTNVAEFRIRKVNSASDNTFESGDFVHRFDTIKVAYHPSSLNFAVLQALGIDRVWANTSVIKQASLGQALLYSRTIAK